VTILNPPAGQISNPNGVSSYVFGMNASGEAAGFAYVNSSGGPDAVTWSGTNATILGGLGGSDDQAMGINDSGQVAGLSVTAGGTVEAVKWTGTTPTILGSIGGESGGEAINNAGQVAGFSYAEDNVMDAVEWTGTSPTILGSLGGSSGSVAFHIDDAGESVGWSNEAGNTAQDAVEWTGTIPTILGTLGGNIGAAQGINNSGEVVGYSLTASGTDNGFLYLSGTMYNLRSR
jgi:probable HAF family extracellular repeat protein